MKAAPWAGFCDLADGRLVAVEMRHTYKEGWKVVLLQPGRSPMENPIVAWSFQEFLERAVNSEGRIDFLEKIL